LNVAVNLERRETLFLLGVCNSLVFDSSLRQKVTTNLTIFYVSQTPVPRLTAADPRFAPIVQRAARLICTTPDFDALAAEAGLRDHRDGVTDPDQRLHLRAELDGLVAHLYGLTEDEFVHILASFPLVPQPAKDATLAAFRAFAPKTADEQAAQLMAAGENLRVEFKSTARWNLKANQADRAMEQIIVKTVAAFLNSEGGDLLIGVDDAGQALGLVLDYKTLGKRADRDGFENWLTTLLLDAYGKDYAPLIAASFPTVNGHELCRVQAQASPRPCFVVGKLFIRAGNSTRELNPQETTDYVRTRWP
jgi:hypothetical protein